MRNSSWPSKLALLAAGIVLTAGLAACGSSGNENDAASAGASSAPASTAAVSSPSSGASASDSSSGDAVTVTAEAADFKWTVSQTEFKAGQPVVFKLSGKEGGHGFSIVGTDISRPVMEGETAEVTWTPDQPGEYTIKCDVMCGSGHRTMETKITVT